MFGNKNTNSIREKVLDEIKQQEFTEAMILEASQNPGGWVYVIHGNYDPNGAIPPQSIAGAWKVDVNGILVREFKENPNFDPK
ncbi:MAG: hypothetical protein ACR2QW_16495 [bacterium]